VASAIPAGRYSKKVLSRTAKSDTEERGEEIVVMTKEKKNKKSGINNSLYHEGCLCDTGDRLMRVWVVLAVLAVQLLLLFILQSLELVEDFAQLELFDVG